MTLGSFDAFGSSVLGSDSLGQSGSLRRSISVRGFDLSIKVSGGVHEHVCWRKKKNKKKQNKNERK